MGQVQSSVSVHVFHHACTGTYIFCTMYRSYTGIINNIDRYKNVCQRPTTEMQRYMWHISYRYRIQQVVPVQFCPGVKIFHHRTGTIVKLVPCEQACTGTLRPVVPVHTLHFVPVWHIYHTSYHILLYRTGPYRIFTGTVPNFEKRKMINSSFLLNRNGNSHTYIHANIILCTHNS